MKEKGEFIEKKSKLYNNKETVMKSPISKKLLQIIYFIIFECTNKIFSLFLVVLERISVSTELNRLKKNENGISTVPCDLSSYC